MKLMLFKKSRETCLQDQRRITVRTHGLREKIRTGASEIRIIIFIRWTAIFRTNFTILLPCIVIDFFLNNQPDALIIPNVFCYKTLHISGILSAHHQEFCTVHSALVSFMQVFDDRFQAESGWKWFCYGEPT